jgi:hypothetical protein
MGNTNLNVIRTRAVQMKTLRSRLLIQLFSFQPPSGTDANTPILNDIANSFSRFAAYQQTAFDSGASRSSSSSDANSMERQVQRAFNQILGGATGRGPDSFMKALNGAFPTTLTGEGQQVAFTPSRSMVSLYNSGGSKNGADSASAYSSGSTLADGYAGTISARQANLYREASIVAADALRVLDGLTPFVPVAELDQVEALRALVRSEINSLVNEFGRVEEPRVERVLTYFSALNTHVSGFGRRAFLDNPGLAVTVDDEAQTAGFELLSNYASTLRKTWDTFFKLDTSPTTLSLSERVERANILLPVIAQVNNDFEAAMDSVGFAESERRSLAARFDTLRGTGVNLSGAIGASIPRSLVSLAASIDLALPDFTVYDLTEWIDRFANFEGPSNLADSGQFGLDFVTDQADRIFWVIAPVVAHLELDKFGVSLGTLNLEQLLSNERVRFALTNLLSQLDSLADLSVPGGKENLLTF